MRTVDGGRHAPPQTVRVGLDAERRDAPVDVGVQIDPTRRDNEPAGVEHPRAHASRQEIVAERGDAGTEYADVGHSIQSLVRIDDAPAAQYRVEHKAIVAAWYRPGTQVHPLGYGAVECRCADRVHAPAPLTPMSFEFTRFSHEYGSVQAFDLPLRVALRSLAETIQRTQRVWDIYFKIVHPARQP